MRLTKILLLTLFLILSITYLIGIRLYGIDEVTFKITKGINDTFISVLDRFNIVRTKTIASTHKLVEENRVGIGIYNPLNDPNTFNSVIDFENTIDRKLEYYLIFRTWGDENEKNFPKEYVEGLKALELTPIITWEPWKRVLDIDKRKVRQPEYSLKSISEGKHDEYIRKWAEDAKESDLPIILRFGHEQSIPVGRIYVYPWQGEPEEYKAAYKHIYNLFKEVGAINVQFMWNPLAFWPDDLAVYYPGSNYVDLIGLSILNHGTAGGEEKWNTCEMLLDTQYRLIEKYNKKVVIAEFASEEEGGDKSEWLIDCMNRIEEKKNIIGLVLLEVVRDTHYNDVKWALTTSKRSLATFKYQISVRNFK